MAPSKKFLQPINLLNAASDPVSADTGDFYYNTTSEKIRYYDGTQWNDVGSGGGVTVSATSPSSPTEGDFWFDNVNGDLYIYDGTYWQQATNTLFVDLYQDTSPQLSAILDANGFGIENIDHLSFDTLSTYIVGEGEIAWNSSEGTFDLGVGGGVTLQVGQEFYAPKVLNLSGVDIPNGSFVMATGAQGDQITIAKAVTDGTIPPEYMLGVATETILNGADDGKVTTNGIVRDIDTSLWPVGTLLYPDPSTAGGFTATKPNAPASRIPIAIVLRQHVNTGRIYVRMDIGKHLSNDLDDVQTTSLQDGDILSYNATSGIWENAPVPVSLPDQTGHSGEFLTTDGTTASWTTVSASGGTNIATDVALSNSWWLGV